MFLKTNLPWLIFALFAIAAIYFHQGEPLFFSDSPYPIGKFSAWILFFGFLAYSYYCSTKENIFTTIKRIYPLHWARQIGIDLYLGLVIAMLIIYLNEGSLLVLAFWVVPILLFANLATLLYVALNFDSIVAHFL